MKLQIKKATFKHVEAELYNYHDTKKEIQRLRQEIIYASDTDPDENDTKGKNSVRTITRPTELIATRLTSNKQLRNLEEIVDAIDSVYEKLEPDQQKLVKLRYWSRKNDWPNVASECKMSESTAYRHRRYIVLAIAHRIGWR